MTRFGLAITLLLSVAVVWMSVAVAINLVRKTRGREQILIKYGAITAIGISTLDIGLYAIGIYRSFVLLDILGAAGYLVLLYGILIFLRKVGPQKQGADAQPTTNEPPRAEP